MRLVQNQRGDTIIEVMLAFVVFSLLAIGAISIMNQGVSAAQRALEITLVRQQIDAQADALRYVHDLANAEDAATLNPDVLADWRKIAKAGPGNYADTSTSDFALQNNGTECPTLPADRFIMNARTGRLHDTITSGVPIQSADAAPFSEVLYSLGTPDTIQRINGIWIEAKKVDGTQNYVDFHIRACWFAAGGSPSIIGTIVRMYDAV